MELYLSDRTITATEAFDQGLIDEVYGSISDAKSAAGWHGRVVCVDGLRPCLGLRISSRSFLFFVYGGQLRVFKGSRNLNHFDGFDCVTCLDCAEVNQLDTTFVALFDFADIVFEVAQ